MRSPIPGPGGWSCWCRRSAAWSRACSSSRCAPEAEGHGTDALIRAFHRGGGQIRGRVPLIKGVASIITIGTGGSAGQEGPIAQIGAGFGSFLGRLLRLTPSERRLLVLAGAAGGIGAIFRAPLGGAMFAVRGPLLDHGHGVRRALALPGQLDRGLLDVRPVHHAQADLHRARRWRSTGSASCRCSPSWRWPARRSGGSTCGCSTASATTSSTRCRCPGTSSRPWAGCLLGLLALGLPAADDRRLWLGAVGGDRHAADAGPAGRAGRSPRRWACATCCWPGAAEDRWRRA